jgi:hypothetical protein
MWHHCAVVMLCMMPVLIALVESIRMLTVLALRLLLLCSAVLVSPKDDL